MKSLKSAEISRRSFLKAVASASAGVVTSGIPGVAFGNSCFSGNRTIVVVHLHGGVNSLEWLVPVRGSSASSEVLQIVEAYELNNEVTGIRETNPTTSDWRNKRSYQYIHPSHQALPITGYTNYGLHWSLGEVRKYPWSATDTDFEQMQTGNLPTDLGDANRQSRSVRQMLTTPVSGGWNCAMINKVGYPSQSYSHEYSQSVYATGARTNPESQLGWLGRVADRYCVVGGVPTSLSFYSFGGRSPEVKASTIDPYVLGRLQDFGFVNDPYGGSGPDSVYAREQFYRGLDRTAPTKSSETLMDNTWSAVRAGGAQLLQAWNTYAAIPIGTSSGQRPRYPTNSLATQFQQVAALIRAGNPPGVAMCSFGSFDTHNSSLISSNYLFWSVNSAISAFEADLRQAGMAQQVTLVLYSEFGRNSYENYNTEVVSGVTVERRGHDHGRGGIALVFGTNVRAGIHGPYYTLTDLQKPEQNSASTGDVVPVIDFREVLSAAITNFGMNPSEIFTDTNRLPNAGINIFS